MWDDCEYSRDGIVSKLSLDVSWDEKREGSSSEVRVGVHVLRQLVGVEMVLLVQF